MMVEGSMFRGTRPLQGAISRWPAPSNIVFSIESSTSVRLRGQAPAPLRTRRHSVREVLATTGCPYSSMGHSDQGPSSLPVAGWGVGCKTCWT